MKRLGIHLNADNSEIQILNVKLDDTERKTAQLNIEFKSLFYNKTVIKDLSVKVNLKEGSQITQQKVRPISIHLQEQVAKELKRLIENVYMERATEITEDYYVSPAVITVKTSQSK